MNKKKKTKKNSPTDSISGNRFYRYSYCDSYIMHYKNLLLYPCKCVISKGLRLGNYFTSCVLDRLCILCSRYPLAYQYYPLILILILISQLLPIGLYFIAHPHANIIYSFDKNNIQNNFMNVK